MTTTTQLVLRVLLTDPTAEFYGLEICERADLLPGTAYPILVRLQTAGWLASRWEEIDPAQEKRPARRYYRLTQDGITEATAALARYESRRGHASKPVTDPSS